MPRFLREIRYYTRGIARVGVSFPENRVVCEYCRFCRADAAFGRAWCQLTGDMLYMPKDTRGEDCPIEIMDDGRGQGDG